MVVHAIVVPSYYIRNINLYLYVFNETILCYVISIYNLNT